MVKCLEITSVSKYHIFALLVPIFYMATNYNQKYQIIYYNGILQENNGCNITTEGNNSTVGYNSTEEFKRKCYIKEIPFFFDIFISKIFSIFLLLYSRHLINEKSSLNLVPTTLMRKYHLHVKNKTRKLKMWLLIVVIGIFEIVFKFENYVTYNQSYYLELKLGIILLVPILSIFILKKQIYKHHIISLVFSFIGVILICLNLLFIKDEYKPVLGEQMRHLFFSIYPSLSLVLTKYLFDNFFINAFSFLVYDGILCIILPFIFVVLKIMIAEQNYFEDNMSGILLFFDDNKSRIYFFSLLFFSFCYYLTNALTLYFFTPMLLISTDILSVFFEWIIDLIFLYIEEDENKCQKYKNIHLVIIFKLVGTLFIIFGAMVFNEILVLHCRDCDKNIKTNIQERGDRELLDNELNTFINQKDDDDRDINFSFESEKIND